MCLKIKRRLSSSFDMNTADARVSGFESIHLSSLGACEQSDVEIAPALKVVHLVAARTFDLVNLLTRDMILLQRDAVVRRLYNFLTRSLPLLWDDILLSRHVWICEGR
jgi:hypothetical protein